MTLQPARCLPWRQLGSDPTLTRIVIPTIGVFAAIATKARFPFRQVGLLLAALCPAVRLLQLWATTPVNHPLNHLGLGSFRQVET
jgi:hypothetical protein